MLHGKLKKCILGICGWCGLHSAQRWKLLLIVLFVCMPIFVHWLHATIFIVALLRWHRMLAVLRRLSRRMMRFRMRRFTLWHIIMWLWWVFSIVLLKMSRYNFICGAVVSMLLVVLVIVILVDCWRGRRFGTSITMNLSFKPFNWNVQCLSSRPCPRWNCWCLRLNLICFSFSFQILKTHKANEWILLL